MQGVDIPLNVYDPLAYRNPFLLDNIMFGLNMRVHRAVIDCGQDTSILCDQRIIST